MKQVKIIGLLAMTILLAFSITFMGCGGSGDPSGPPPSTEVFQYSQRIDGVIVDVLISESVVNASVRAVTDNSNYIIRRGGTVILSRGKVAVNGENLTFKPDGGGAEFPGTLSGNTLKIASIPYSGGTIPNFTGSPVSSSPLSHYSSVMP